VLALTARQVVRTPGTDDFTGSRIAQQIDPTLRGFVAGVGETANATSGRACGVEAPLDVPGGVDGVDGGLDVLRPAGTYFANVDAGRDGAAFCRELVEGAGVVAIPTGVFYDDPQAGATLVRFAFCKRAEVIDEAARRLSSA
jgi:hypothetical protein